MALPQVEIVILNSPIEDDAFDIFMVKQHAFHDVYMKMEWDGWDYVIQTVLPADYFPRKVSLIKSDDPWINSSTGTAPF